MIDLSSYDSPRGVFPFRAEPRKDERVVHVHLWTQDEPQQGLCDALAMLGADYRAGGTYERVDWPKFDSPERRARAVLEAVREVKPTLIWMQLQTPGVVSPALVALMREASPEAVIVSWCGDIGRDPKWSHELAPHLDAVLFSSMTQVREHRAVGFPNAAYLQIGYDEAYHIPDPLEEAMPCAPSRYERLPRVAFLGQNYVDKHWARWLPGHEAQLRRDVVQALLAAEIPLALHGANWPRPPAGPPLNPRQSALVYRQSQLALSISLTSKLERYSSDRLFRALACGCAVLVKRFDDMEALGLQDGFNCMAFDTPEEAVGLAQELLAERWMGGVCVMGEAGAILARERHTWRVRMAEQQVYLNAIRVAR